MIYPFTIVKFSCQEGFEPLGKIFKKGTFCATCPSVYSPAATRDGLSLLQFGILGSLGQPKAKRRGEKN
jgi:hypothetical protein